MTAVETLIKEYFGCVENCTPDFQIYIKKAIQKEKDDLAYFFNNNDYNSNFSDFEEQYEYLKNKNLQK